MPHQSSFFKIVSDLLIQPSSNTLVTIQGQSKHLKGFAEFKTVNLGDDNYYKMVFDDHSLLLLIPSIEAVYYADSSLGTAEGITDTMIGHDDIISYHNKQYRIENKNDYQYVVRLYVGGPDDIEGECCFSDYVSVDNPEEEQLSLGWIVKTGRRADVLAKRIAAEEVRVIV